MGWFDLPDGMLHPVTGRGEDIGDRGCLGRRVVVSIRVLLSAVVACLFGGRKPGQHRLTRLVAPAVVVLVATSVTPAPALEAGGFSDVSAGETHEAAIAALADLGVFTDTECGDGLFCPDDPVTRWVMAVWLIRVLGYEVTTAGTSRFGDVDASEWWSPYTEELADRDITAGCDTGPLRYCPDQPVPRAQMATFLVLAFGLGSAPPAGFTDTEGNTHQTNIDALAAARITAGCKTDPPTPLRYCPDDPVTRAQMATFLHRALLRQKEQAAEAGAIAISDDVPDMDLTDLSTGESVNLRSFVTGDKALLLWFWSPY